MWNLQNLSSTARFVRNFSTISVSKSKRHHFFKDPNSSYLQIYNDSLNLKFFNEQKFIEFDGEYTCRKSMENFTFEIDGYLNAAYNCIDRHPSERAAIYWETNEINSNKAANTMTYGELLSFVSQLSNTLIDMGIQKGDRVGICAGQTPYSIIAMLACARIGAIHVVVFAGFSSEAIRERLSNAKAKVVICTDIGKHGTKTIPIFETMSNALPTCVEKVIIAIRPNSIQELKNVHFSPNFDNTALIKAKLFVSPHLDNNKCVFWDEVVVKQRTYCPPAKLHAEEPLFILHTSGSSGHPKGLLHSTGGYLMAAAYSTKFVFDLQENEVLGCMADCGWVAGHTFMVYGPLALGATTVLFEPTPVYPTPSRYSDCVKKWNINTLFTAPTAIRVLKKHNKETGNLLNTSCKVLGCAGEPINPDAWQYYKNEFGSNQCEVVDTYWQTETGSVLLSPIPYVTPTKPGSACLPFLGISPKLVDVDTHEVIEGNNVEGMLAISEPWPSMARTIWGDHQRFLKTYFKNKMYITGDTAFRDEDGYYWIRGRIDDMVNVAGHRLSTAEVEAALAKHPDCIESASIGIPDGLTGQAVITIY